MWCKSALKSGNTAVYTTLQVNLNTSGGTSVRVRHLWPSDQDVWGLLKNQATTILYGLLWFAELNELCCVANKEKTHSVLFGEGFTADRINTLLDGNSLHSVQLVVFFGLVNHLKSFTQSGKTSLANKLLRLLIKKCSAWYESSTGTRMHLWTNFVNKITFIRVRGCLALIGVLHPRCITSLFSNSHPDRQAAFVSAAAT